MGIRMFIVINLRHEATHYWKDCNLSDVEYLKHPHRHEFHITCKKVVDHKDRDIEFITMKQNIQRWLKAVIGKQLHGLSCEALGCLIMEKFKLSYVQVLEDGENGAEIFSTSK